MNGQTQDVRGVVERLEKVEDRSRALARENRRLKVVGAAVLVLVAAILLVGAVTPSPRVLEAEQFLVVDDKGKRHAELSVFKGTARLAFYDGKGRYTTGLAMLEGGASLVFLDEQGKHRATFGYANGRPILGLLDGKATRVLLVVTEGEAGLALFDKNAKQRAVLTASELGTRQGSVALKFAGHDEKDRLLLAEAGLETFGDNERRCVSLGSVKGESKLELYDRKGKRRVLLNVLPGMAGLGLFDYRQRPRLGLSVLPGGSPVVELMDRKGQTIWQAPPADEAPEEEEAGE